MKGEVKFNKERVVNLDKHVFLSFHIRHFLLLNNVMFAEYLHYMSGTELHKKIDVSKYSLYLQTNNNCDIEVGEASKE